MKIVLIGGYPPPLGGSTVHIQRLADFLLQEGYDVQVLDQTGYDGSQPDFVCSLQGGMVSKLLQVIHFSSGISSKAVVHFHIASMQTFRWVGLFLMILFWRQKKIITLHSGSFVPNLQHPLMRMYVRSLFPLMDAIVAVNIHQREALIKLGISSEKLHVIPAFIASPVNLKLLPTELDALAPGKIRVITSGYLTPIYGYDTLIECISAFADTHDFVFTFYNEVDLDYQKHIMARLKHYTNVQVFWNLMPDAFMSVLCTATIYVRATLTDGDAVAIREAMLLNKIVFASDAVVRPSECYLFETGNAQSLHALLSLHLLGELPEQESTKNRMNDSTHSLLSIYQTLLVD